MRLGEFIQNNLEAILIDWETFVPGIWPPNSKASPTDLRDHAAQIVRALIADMQQDQSHAEQAKNSKGDETSGGAESDTLDDASVVHGIARVSSGLSILEVVAEYRALRASVLRQWRASGPADDSADVDDLTRFNEAIDQSLTRAVASFTHRLDESRKMFLAILGHDLRSPLAAITLCAKLAQDPESVDDQKEMLSTVISSADAIAVLLADLIDFTSSTLGVQIPLSVAPTDLHTVCEDASNEARGANPGRDVQLVVCGDTSGRSDASRVRQVVSNLLGNAVQHGDSDAPVTLTLDGTADNTVVLTVHNSGKPVPKAVLPTIFDPLVRGQSTVEKRRKPGSIGLGLYIAREITVAHGGAIDLISIAAQGTTATVRLPR